MKPIFYKPGTTSQQPRQRLTSVHSIANFQALQPLYPCVCQVIALRLPLKGQWLIRLTVLQRAASPAEQTPR